MSDSPGVIVSTDLGSFFRSEVCSATRTLGVELSQETEYYVVNLLCEYSHRGTALMPGDEPLAILYQRALEVSRRERVPILKDLGDVALYAAGFFVEFIECSMVDIGYYVSMGGNAYNNLSDIFGSQPQGEVFAGVYNQMAQKFTSLVDVLTEISNKSRDQAETDESLVRLYDRWLRTGSDRLHRLLVEKGLLFNSRPPDEFLQ